MSATMTPTAFSKLANLTAITPLPALQWAVGTVHEILVQPGEKFYIFSVRQADGTTLFLRIADPHTGGHLNGVNAENLVYDTMKEAYFRNLQVQAGYRDFGPDPQAGINKLVIDRVILTQ
ncbi:MAG TPA: hypothetical protein VFD98_09705 [Terracidiphilus sp.]|jgi:hypothetical protein|nr:hypothetical protein [Terracidiphilus sp.]